MASDGEWTLGAAYGFERYNWTNYVAAATNENSGKVFADWKPASWFTLRSVGTFLGPAIGRLRPCEFYE